MADAKAPVERPLSPHLSIYRPMLTMMMSIAHRITGVALYFGTLLLAWWLIAAASGPNAYARRSQSFIELVVRPADAVRLHLGADASHARRHPPSHLGHRPRLRAAASANGWRIATLVGSIALTIVIWVVGYLFIGGPR